MELPKVEPVFIRAGDIPDFKTPKEYQLCQAICEQISKEKLRIEMLWRVYLKDIMNQEF